MKVTEPMSDLVSDDLVPDEFAGDKAKTLS